MSAWADPLGDVRKVLSDGPTDKLRYRKQVLNILDGVNKTFKTFEMRRVSTFVAPTAPSGVFVDNVLATVDSEDLMSGEFVLHTAPTNGQTLLATYYYQWFIDSEISEFLVQAAEWIGNQDDFVDTIPDLRPAAKEYAASVAYQKLVSRFAENLAEVYQLYDAPDQKRFNPVDAYQRISDAKMKRALQLRDDVYKMRKGQAFAPKFKTISGTNRDVPPNR